MAKKKIAKTVVGLGALAVAGKLAYDKYKVVKEEFSKEENESIASEVRKYNAIFDKKIVEIEDEEFTGCEVKVVGSKAVIDLGLASFEKDVYINFSSTASTVTIILPEGVNATCDIEKTCSGVRNLVTNVDEEGIHTVYVIGKAVMSNVEVIPVNFYVDDDDDFEDVLDEADSSDKADEAGDKTAEQPESAASEETGGENAEEPLEIKEIPEESSEKE